ncbi:lipopolysaccharide transport periplasmic protein LptA [Marinibacterium sp. SX1]|uniref:lipopolysaccharide transport periplasmic protein LptA n=1 Tax=Marinibacterium sp. SX1 TaxID=3388424 RepID=UPI003D17DB86
MPRLTCLALTAGLLAQAAAAQGTNLAFGGLQADTSQPVEVTADALDVDQADGTAVFTGNVVVGQGVMRLSATEVLVVYKQDRSGIERLVATGDVVLVNGPDAAEAEKADYTIDSGIIVMTGDVLLTQGQNALSGERLNVDLAAGTARMTGRVRTILIPEDE